MKLKRFLATALLIGSAVFTMPVFADSINYVQIESLDSDDDGIQKITNQLYRAISEKEDSITLYITTDCITSEESTSFPERLIKNALTVEDNCDYIYYQYGGYDIHSSKTGNEFVLDLDFIYYTTDDQEKKVDKVAKQFAKSVEDCTELEVIQEVYSYLQNTEYDYDNADNTDNTIRHTAYAALVKKEATCQGFANAAYRLFDECGIECRIVQGTVEGSGNHAWNIVSIDGQWYYFDATSGSTTQTDKYCLKGSNNAAFSSYILDDDCNFTIATEDYKDDTSFLQKIVNKLFNFLFFREVDA